MPSTYLNKVMSWLADIVFPVRCLKCGKFKSEEDLPYACHSCLIAVKIRAGFECIGCKREVPFGKTCIACSADWSISNLFISADYHTPLVASLIKALKYGFAGGAVHPLFYIVHRFVQNLSSKKNFSIFSDNPLVMPIPLAKRRLNWRGFNQSELLAELISATYYMEIRPDLVERRFTSHAQAHISSREERLENVASAFSVTLPDIVRNRDILLVDDVCTTGATLNACARALKEVGAKNISALVIARDSYSPDTR